MQDYSSHDATALADLVHRGDVTPLELVDAAIERIEFFLFSYADGTGSHIIDAELGVLTELQVGSYVFMDREYNDCEQTGAFETSLMVDASVISANSAGLVTIDAGLKAFAADAGPPVILGTGARYRFMGDEHGALIGTDLPVLGGRVTLATSHCDPTVNLFDAYHAVREDTLVAIWPVTARGRSA